MSEMPVLSEGRDFKNLPILKRIELDKLTFITYGNFILVTESGAYHIKEMTVAWSHELPIFETVQENNQVKVTVTMKAPKLVGLIPFDRRLGH